MPRSVSVPSLQQALAVMGVYTSTSGVFDQATGAGLASVIASLPSSTRPRVDPSETPGTVLITPGAWVDQMKDTARILSGMLGRVPRTPAGSNGAMLIWLCAARAYTPVMASNMAERVRNGVISRETLVAYNAYMNALDAASLAYGELLESNVDFQRAVMSVSAMTEDYGDLNTPYSLVKKTWTNPLPRFTGDLLPAGGLGNPIVIGALVIGGVAITGGFITWGIHEWQKPAVERARAAREQARANRVMAEAMPPDMTPEQYLQALPEINRAEVHTSDDPGSSGFSLGLGLGVLAAAGIGAYVLVPGVRDAVNSLFGREPA